MTLVLRALFTLRNRSQNHVMEVNKMASPQSGRKLPWDNFSAWISCFCVVTFDLELGQVIEVIYI